MRFAGDAAIGNDVGLDATLRGDTSPPRTAVERHGQPARRLILSITATRDTTQQTRSVVSVSPDSDRAPRV